ncbi:MAG TPA: FUSC family protein [Nitrososphaeraceae archaeon]|nr:FUSC family protein [Nitrososphaeraceae archaeon]
MWAIIGGKIFPLHIFSSVVKEGAVQEQHVKTKVTWRDRITPLTDSLSIHSQNFQYALVVAITAAIGMTISRWFELHEGIWIVVTINVVLNRNYHEISTSWTVWKVVHRIIGTIIGAVIALIIIDNIQDIWLLSFLLFIFMTTYLIFIRIKNYAFTVIFMTTFILLFIDIGYQSTSTLTPLERIENIFIGSILCLIASILWRSSSRRKPSPLLHNKTE